MQIYFSSPGLWQRSVWLFVAVLMVCNLSTRALAFEVPIAECRAPFNRCGDVSPYSRPIPPDWDAAAEEFCFRWTINSCSRGWMSSCDGSTISTVISCKLDPLGRTHVGAASFTRYTALQGYDLRHESLWGDPSNFAYFSPTCDCPEGAAFNLRGGCECAAHSLWDGTRCIAASGCTGEKYLGGCTKSASTAAPPAIVVKNNGGQPDCIECGDSFNPSTGINTKRELILRTPTLELGLTYNSRIAGASVPEILRPFGQDWTHSFGMQVLTAGAGNVGVTRSDGRILEFRPPADGQIYEADPDVADRLETIVDDAASFAGWRLTRAVDDAVERYDADGRLQSITTRNGVVTTLTYSDPSTPRDSAPKANLLLAVTDPFGRQLSFRYDFRGRVLEVRDPAAGIYSFAYDGATAAVRAGKPVASNLTSVTFPDGAQRVYSYNDPELTSGADLPNALTGIDDENGTRFLRVHYDSSGRTMATVQGTGVNRFGAVYNSDDTSTITDPFGTSRVYVVQVRNGVARTSSIVGPDCPSCGPKAQSIDAHGNTTSRVDWNDNRTHFELDLGRNLEVRRTSGLTASGASTPKTRVVTTQYHPYYRLPTRIAEPLKITTMQYGDWRDANPGNRGSLLTRSIQATDDVDGSSGFAATPLGAPRTWTFHYNTQGDILTRDGPRTDVNDTTTYAYYVADAACPTDGGGDATGCRGQVATTIDPFGHKTRVTAYDALGQALAIVDANRLVTELSYDKRQRLIARVVGGEKTTYEYDRAGQLTRVSLPDGASLAYSYDAAHRLIGLRDKLGNRIAYKLDAAGNRLEDEVYDPADQLAEVRRRVYSDLNRMVRKIGAHDQTTEYAHDGEGQVIKVKDPLARITMKQYDAFKRLVQVTDPNRGITRYAYDGQNAVVAITDARDLTTSYAIDGLGNQTSVANPDAGTTRDIHDTAGNVTARTDAKGQVAQYVYDALDRATSVRFADGKVHAYTYDQGQFGIGRLSRVDETSADGSIRTTDYAYDVMGRVTLLTTRVNGVSYATAYRYDDLGHLVEMAYPSGRTVGYAYDAGGRVARIDTQLGVQGFAVIEGVTYHPFGGVTGFTLGNSQTYARVIDQDGRIASYTLGGEMQALSFDAAGRILAIVGNRPASYVYDDLDRLTGANTTAGIFRYSYDAVGNRLARHAGSSADTYTYAATSNRLARMTSAHGGTTIFTFDASGSMTSDGVRQFTYDPQGRLMQTTSSQLVTRYELNADGQRVRKTGARGDIVFHYDNQRHLIAETKADTGATIREYLWLGNIPVMLFVDADPYWTHTDHLSTPRAIYDRGGKLVWRWDNTEPFGDSQPAVQPTAARGQFEMPLAFLGTYRDSESGKLQNGYRDLDPALGRYLQSDPIGLAGGLNTYAHVYSDPLRWTDPLGLATCGSGWSDAVVPDNPLGIPFSECCSDHDACYDDCAARPSKSACDSAFGNCMRKRCNSQWLVVRPLCWISALEYYGAVNSFGAEPLRQARAKCDKGQCRNPQGYVSSSPMPPR